MQRFLCMFQVNVCFFTKLFIIKLLSLFIFDDGILHNIICALINSSNVCNTIG